MEEVEEEEASQEVVNASGLSNVDSAAQSLTSSVTTEQLKARLLIRTNFEEILENSRTFYEIVGNSRELFKNT